MWRNASGRVGWGKHPLKGTLDAGKNPFGKYRLCAMNGQVYYLSYIPCGDMFDVVSEKSCSHFNRGSYGGVRSPPTGQEAY